MDVLTLHLVLCALGAPNGCSILSTRVRGFQGGAAQRGSPRDLCKGRGVLPFPTAELSETRFSSYASTKNRVWQLTDRENVAVFRPARH